MEELIATLGGKENALLLGVYACLFLVIAAYIYKLVAGFARLLARGIRSVRARKARRAEAGRRLAYALPERENEYLRERLQSVLREEPQDKSERSGRAELAYALKMLAEVRLAPLSPVERLEVEELSGALALYQSKQKWAGGDTRAVSDLLSRLVKLSAKYEIAI